MDKQKQLDLIRERNANLNKTVEELKDKIEFDKNYNQESLKRAKSLIEELEMVKMEWTESIEELREKQNQYDELIEQTKRLRSLIDKEMVQRGFSRRERRQIFRMVDKDAKLATKEMIKNKE